MTGGVAIILKGYPRLSETFIAQEILALQQRGLDLRLISLRHPTDRRAHPVHRDITAPVSYLPEYLYREPLRVLRAWLAQRRTPFYKTARRTWWRDLRRDPTPNRIRRFGQALVLAQELAADTVHLHAHFLHTPTSVTRYAAMLTGLPWSASAHAKDIWMTPAWEKTEKLADCAWITTCTRAGHDHLTGLAVAAGVPADKVMLVYHGIDFARFPAPEAARPKRDGSRPDDPVILLSVGRAVAKKGYDILLDALAQLPADLHWRLVHIGGGPLLPRLKRRAKALGLGDRITWQGAQPQEAVLAHYRAADLFVLASRIAADGDRDGLPNVLMEAQSQGLACLSTRIAAVPELIEAGETGVLVRSGDAAALARAMADLISEPERRQVLGQAGADRVRQLFPHDAGIGRLAAKFNAPAMPADTVKAAAVA